MTRHSERSEESSRVTLLQILRTIWFYLAPHTDMESEERLLKWYFKDQK